jgi:holo-[acyl-carrier protein] synthase
MNAGFATGLDVVELARFETLLARTPEFAERYFAAEERERCAACVRPTRELAIAFAVKEALVKALGVGVLGAIALDQIIVERDGPLTHVHLRGAAAQSVGARRVLASTACDRTCAWAFVVIA